MSDRPIKTELELRDDPAFQRSVHWFELVGRTTMTLLVLATLLGIFGRGYLSYAGTSTDDGSLSCHFERFGRMQSTMDIELDIERSSASEGSDDIVELWVDREWLDDMKIDHLTPQPWRVHTAGDHYLYEFLFRPGDRDGHIQLSLQPERYGRMRGKFSLNNGERLSFTQWIFP